MPTPKKINSRAKGARGERELALFLSDRGFEARRGQQFKGTSDSPDVECKPLSRWHIECKFVEKLNLLKAFLKCKEECSPLQKPIVMHRVKRGPWLATMELEDFLKLERKIHDYNDSTIYCIDKIHYLKQKLEKLEKLNG